MGFLFQIEFQSVSAAVVPDVALDRSWADVVTNPSGFSYGRDGSQIRGVEAFPAKE